MHYISRKNTYALVILVIFGVLLSGCAQSREKTDPSEQEDHTIAAEQVQQQKEGIQTLLVSCVEPFDVSRDSGSYRNGNKADLIMLMVTDEEAGKTTVLQLNPDTMVSFSVPGMSETVQIPLGLSFSYGSGGSDSCLNQSKAVSNLLEGIPVDHYMVFTMDSIAVVNDMLGGVTVAIEEDFQAEYPGLPEGENLVLMGETAIEFFRYRSEEDVANEAHMERQRRYMAGLYRPFMENAQNEDFLARLTIQLGDGLSTDLTLSQMVQMLALLDSYKLDETILTLQGDASKAAGEFQYRVDKDSLDKMLESLFY